MTIGWIPVIFAVLIFALVIYLGMRDRCKHEMLVCTHGDEINWLNGKRGRCLMCGKLFDFLPDICAWTGDSHDSNQT